MDRSDKYINSNFTYNDMLQKADPNNHQNFRSTLVLIFELDIKIMEYMSDNNIIEFIDTSNGNPCNYIQLISDTCVDKILSYLFCDTSREFTDDENVSRILHIRKIMRNYENANAYFDKISERLWKETPWFRDTYDYYYTMASRKIVLELEKKSNIKLQTKPYYGATIDDCEYDGYTKPTKCSSLRQNGFAIIQGHPCKIVGMTTSKD